MEKLFLERNRANAREACDSIAFRMKDCYRLGSDTLNDPTFYQRRKASEITSFLRELQEGEEDFGGLGLLSGFQKARFQLLNDMDSIISDRMTDFAKQLPRQVKASKVK